MARSAICYRTAVSHFDGTCSAQKHLLPGTRTHAYTATRCQIAYLVIPVFLFSCTDNNEWRIRLNVVVGGPGDVFSLLPVCGKCARGCDPVLLPLIGLFRRR